ncbi:helix-turn-helix transcriptional regulator [Dyadobacter sp. CY345]|uniref:helix-turn-helix domain-containing protein n=1 Tax=Dyadobacter sp. CY345 TaxID=2909335 RepID=UPI001F3E501C|nr:helix-turn-helix transcriptional regulator [Dyadobacter sp. CY345]MCF2443046.1 helix-turn-helix transcriptional regulator [Dyadobacter sp. CY345]
MLLENSFERLIAERVKAIDAIASQLPVIVIIQKIADFSVLYMSPKGLDLLGMTLLELQEIKAEYQHRFFNIEDSEEYWPKFRSLLLENNMDQNLSYLQQVKHKDRVDWAWYISATRIFLQDETGAPFLMITTATAIDDMKHMPSKAERLLKENNFLRNNYQKFSMLGKREKEILKMVSLGYSSPEIGDRLHIASATVDAHRKNIKRKLAISSYYDFAEYARAFDLI